MLNIIYTTKVINWINRAAKELKPWKRGFVSPANHVGKRDVLIPEISINADLLKKKF